MCVFLQVLFLWVFSRGPSQYALLRGFIFVHSFAWAISTGSFAVGFFTSASTGRFLPGCLPCVPWQGLFLGDSSRGFYPCAPSFDPIWRVFCRALCLHLFAGTFQRTFSQGLFSAIFCRGFLRAFNCMKIFRALNRLTFFRALFCSSSSVRFFAGAFPVRLFRGFYPGALSENRFRRFLSQCLSP